MTDISGALVTESDEGDELLDELGLVDVPTRRKAAALRNLYSNNEVARALFNALAGRTRNHKELTTRRTAQLLGSSETAITALFRELAKAEVGEYVPGRHGHPSRFVWRYKLLSVASAACEANSNHSLEPLPEPNEDGQCAIAEVGLLRHSYQLRPEWKWNFALPRDLSVGEAARLARFIETLPFG